jgi:hypothetical protein
MKHVQVTADELERLAREHATLAAVASALGSNRSALSNRLARNSYLREAFERGRASAGRSSSPNDDARLDDDVLLALLLQRPKSRRALLEILGREVSRGELMLSLHRLKARGFVEESRGFVEESRGFVEESRICSAFVYSQTSSGAEECRSLPRVNSQPAPM